MNFLWLALAIFAALIAANSLTAIARVAVGQGAWNSLAAFFANVGYVSVFGALAVWLFRLALGL